MLKEWTVIAYIIGDDANTPANAVDRLDAAARQEAEKMLQSTRGLDSLHLAVHVDLTKEPGSLRSIGTRKLEHFPGEPHAGIQGLREFVEEVRIACPAKHYMLVLWGHGAGPLGMFADGNGAPDSTPGVLSITDLDEVLNITCGACAVPRLDIILVKSCFMATLEAAWEIADRAQFLICSQAKVPMRTWRIWDVFETLQDLSPAPAAAQLLAALGRHYDDAVERNGRKEVPFTCIETGRIRDIQTVAESFVSHLRMLRGVRSVETAIERARPLRAGDKALLDLRTLCGLLVDSDVPDPDLKGFAATLDDFLTKHVIRGHVPEDSRFRGLGIFHFPRDPLLRAESFANDVGPGFYGTLAFCQATGWHDIAFPTAIV